MKLSSYGSSDYRRLDHNMWATRLVNRRDVKLTTYILSIFIIFVVRATYMYTYTHHINILQSFISDWLNLQIDYLTGCIIKFWSKGIISIDAVTVKYVLLVLFVVDFLFFNLTHMVYQINSDVGETKIVQKRRVNQILVMCKVGINWKTFRASESRRMYAVRLIRCKKDQAIWILDDLVIRLNGKDGKRFSLWIVSEYTLWRDKEEIKASVALRAL